MVHSIRARNTIFPWKKIVKCEDDETPRQRPALRCFANAVFKKNLIGTKALFGTFINLDLPIPIAVQFITFF